MNSSGDEAIFKVNMLDVDAVNKSKLEERNPIVACSNPLSPPRISVEQYHALLDAIRNVNLEMEERISKQINDLKSTVMEITKIKNLEEVDDMKRDTNKLELQLEATEHNLRVKVCKVHNCSYVERKTTNNMKYHYVLYHEDMEYPNKSFDEVEMSFIEYECLKKHWIESDQRLTTLARRREKKDGSFKKRKWKQT